MASVGTRQEFKDRVLVRLGRVESSKLKPTTNAIEAAVADAIDEYSKRKPRDLVHQQAGDDTTKRVVLTDTVTDWITGTSRVVNLSRVSDPDSDDEVEYEYEEKDWRVVKDTTGKDVLLFTYAVGTGNTLRIRWQNLHTIHDSDSALTTIPEGDTEICTLFALVYLERWIARTAYDLSDSGFGADQVDYEMLGKRWDQRADHDFDDALKRISPESAGGTGGSVEWPSESIIAKQSRIAH